MIKSETGSSSVKSRWLIIVALLLFTAWLIIWMLVFEPDHDEIEHLHAAWLMHQSQQPFTDFFEHHTPLLWNLIRIYYLIFGENYSVLPFFRFIMILQFALIIGISVSIARRWISLQGSWIAAFGFPLFSLGYLLANICIRGDPFILFFLLCSFWLAVRLVDAKHWSGREVWQLFVFFICLGIAIGFSPRAGIPAVTLFLSLFIFSLRSLSRPRLILLFFFGVIIVLLPTILQAAIYGFKPFFFWTYYFSASLTPSFSPLNQLQRIATSAAGVWILAILGIVRFFRDSELRSHRSVWILFIMAGVNFFGLWASSRPFMQHFLMTIPFFGFLAGFGYDYLTRTILPRLPKWNWAGWILLLAILMLCGKFYQIWVSGVMEDRYKWTQRAEWLRNNAGDQARFAGGLAYFQPIFLEDAFYYWFAGRYAKPTFSKLQPDFIPYTLQDLQRVSPELFHQSFAENWDFIRLPEYREWIKANYDPTPYKGYWLKKK